MFFYTSIYSIKFSELQKKILKIRHFYPVDLIPPPRDSLKKITPSLNTCLSFTAFAHPNRLLSNKEISDFKKKNLIGNILYYVK